MEDMDEIKETSTGMRHAEEVMDEFMEKLNDGEFKKDTLPQYDEGFDPTNEEEAERVMEGFVQLLEDIKMLKLQ